MTHGGLPDGEGVIDRKARPGRVIAFYAALVGAGALGMLGLQSLVRVDAQAAVARKSSDDPTLATIAADVRDIKTQQGEQGRTLVEQGKSIAAILRQLGLDGLGPPARRGQ